MNDGFSFTHPDEQEQAANARLLLNASIHSSEVGQIDRLIREKTYRLEVCRRSLGILDQNIAILEQEIADLVDSRDGHIERRLEA